MNYQDLLSYPHCGDSTSYRVMCACPQETPQTSPHIPLCPNECSQSCINISEHFCVDGLCKVCGASIQADDLRVVCLGCMVAVSLKYSVTLSYCDCCGCMQQVTRSGELPICMSACQASCGLQAKLVCGPTIDCSCCGITVCGTICVMPAESCDCNCGCNGGCDDPCNSCGCSDSCNSCGNNGCGSCGNCGCSNGCGCSNSCNSCGNCGNSCGCY